MRAIEKTTNLFAASVREAIPCVRIQIVKSVTRFGRSHYVYIWLKDAARPLKVRISDHQVGMTRAKNGSENLYLHARAKPHHWAVWLSELARSASIEAEIEEERREDET